MGVLRSSAFIGRCEIDTHAILVKSPVLPWSTSPASIVSTNVRIFQGSVHGIRADFHFGPTPGAGTLGLLAPIPTSVIPANGDLCVTPVVGSSFPKQREWRHSRNGGIHGANRHSRDGGPRAPQSSFPEGGNPRRGPAMGSRLHGNDGRRRRRIHGSHIVIPTSSFPRRRESTAGGRRWVPVSTGTTGGGGAPHNRHSQNSGNPRQPHRHSHNGGNPRQPHRHSRDGGNPRRGPAMGSPLHGNDEPRRRTHNRHSQNGGNPRQPHRHSRDGNPRRGAGDGFPSPRERRAAAAHPTIVIPKTAGIHGSHIVIPATAGIHGRRGPAMGSPLHGNDGRRRRTPQSSFPQQRESTAATSSFPRRRESIPDMVRHHDS